MLKIVKFILLIVLLLNSFQQAQSQQKSLTYEQITGLLEQLLKNNSVSTPDFKTQVNDVKFSQCTMNLSILSSIPNKDSTMELLYKNNIKFLKETRYGKNPNMNNAGLVRLYFDNKLIQTEIFKAGTVASLTDTITIAVVSEDAALNISNFFDELAKICKKETNKQTTLNEPTLKETTDWLTDNLEKTFIVDESNKTTKYEQIRFSQCQMNVKELHDGEASKFSLNYVANLESLEKVKVGKNSIGIGGVTLEFSKNFNFEFVFSDGEKELVRENKFLIKSRDYEKAKRIGVAFTRLLDLCGKDTKEPF